MSRCLFAAFLMLFAVTGCRKQNSAAAPSTGTSTNSMAAAGQTADVDATLAELTRELHRAMIGHKLSGSFEEFVAIRQLHPPPPPPGKKYAISKQWKVILVDQ